jgi:hypothetical protein
MTISFNDWLLYTSHEVENPQTREATAAMAAVWQKRKGRLTLQSVAKRAQLEYGLPAIFAQLTWEAYLAQVLPAPTPVDDTPPLTEGTDT